MNTLFVVLFATAFVAIHANGDCADRCSRRCQRVNDVCSDLPDVLQAQCLSLREPCINSCNKGCDCVSKCQDLRPEESTGSVKIDGVLGTIWAVQCRLTCGADMQTFIARMGLDQEDDDLTRKIDETRNRSQEAPTLEGRRRLAQLFNRLKTRYTKLVTVQQANQ